MTQIRKSGRETEQRQVKSLSTQQSFRIASLHHLHTELPHILKGLVSSYARRVAHNYSALYTIFHRLCQVAEGQLDYKTGQFTPRGNRYRRLNPLGIEFMVGHTRWTRDESSCYSISGTPLHFLHFSGLYQLTAQ